MKYEQRESSAREPGSKQVGQIKVITQAGAQVAGGGN